MLCLYNYFYNFLQCFTYIYIYIIYKYIYDICFETLSPASSALIGCSPSKGEGAGSNAKRSCQDKEAAPGGAWRTAKGPSVVNCEKQCRRHMSSSSSPLSPSSRMSFPRTGWEFELSTDWLFWRFSAVYWTYSKSGTISQGARGHCASWRRIKGGGFEDE